MRVKKTSTALEKYLYQVDRRLKHMSVTEKTDILSELKNSFYERQKNGQTEDEIIAEMESPKSLAMSYLGESITRYDSFSWKNFMMVLGFYSYASLVGAIIIPILAVLAAAFFFSSGISILAGVLGMLKGVVHIPLVEDLRFMVFTYELKGLQALLFGLILAIIFMVVGILFWKGTVAMVRILQTQRWKLRSERV